MRRRDFMTGIAGSAAAWPLTARAQPERIRRVGVLMNTADDLEGHSRVAAFVQGLRNWAGATLATCASTFAGLWGTRPSSQKCGGVGCVRTGCLAGQYHPGGGHITAGDHNCSDRVCGTYRSSRAGIVASLARPGGGGLLQAPLRRSKTSPALSRPLHPSRRHLKSPPDRMRRERRHLQVKGLQDRRSRPLQGDDARHPRVHSPLSHPRAARRLPSIRYYCLLASGRRAENSPAPANPTAD